MVGVPGKSKGCHTCKKRKIACGLQRPLCAQCIKSNRVCTGYQRERVFIVNQGLVEKKPGANLRTSPSGNDVSPSASQKKDDGFQRSLVCTEPARAVLTHSTPIRALLGNKKFQQIANRQQLLSTFLDSFIPAKYLSQIERKPWLMHLPDLSTMTVALETSVFALCTAKLGRMHDDPVLLNESLQLYTRGLRELQRSLWNPQLMYKDETLAACMALTMYEAVECPGGTKKGYVSHQNGCSRLVQLRGVESCTSGFGCQLFLSFRNMGILQALQDHRSTYLSDAVWCEIPWKNSTKSPMDRVLDALVQAPELFRQGDRLKDLEPQELLMTTLAMIDKCWKLEADLHKVYEELERSSLGPLYWPKLSTRDNPADDQELGKVFPVAFHFLNIRIATTLMFYWASLTMIWSGLSQLYRIIGAIQMNIRQLSNSSDNSCYANSDNPSHDDAYSYENDGITFSYTQFDIGQLQPLEHRVDFVTLIRNICQSVEYCVQDEMMGLGLSAVAAPLGVAVENLKENPSWSRELMWVWAELNKLHDNGLQVLKYFHKP